MPCRLVLHYHRADLQLHPEWLWVFGDNLAGIGRCGQAAQARGEPNAIGFPTKRTPWEFLCDDDLYHIRSATCIKFATLRYRLLDGGVVILPTNSIGSGLAELPQRAPTIDKWYKQQFAQLQKEFP